MTKSKKNAKIKAAVFDTAAKMLDIKGVKICAVMAYDNHGEKYGAVLGGGDENDIKKFAEGMEECAHAILAGIEAADSDDDADGDGNNDDEVISDEDIVKTRITKILLDRGLADKDGEPTLKFLRIAQKVCAKAGDDEKSSEKMALGILKECAGDKLTDEEWEVAKRIYEKED